MVCIYLLFIDDEIQFIYYQERGACLTQYNLMGHCLATAEESQRKLLELFSVKITTALCEQRVAHTESPAASNMVLNLSVGISGALHWCCIA